MMLGEALENAREGCFVTCNGLASNESIHWHNGKYYFEDGAVVTEDFLYERSWAFEGDWYIKAFLDDIDIEKLNKMHENSNGLMLFAGSYEDCIVKR